MTNDDLLLQLRRVASDVFNVPVETITEASSPDSIGGWDSVQHLNFILAIEQQFGVQLEPDDIEQMQSIGAALKVVTRGGPRSS